MTALKTNRKNDQYIREFARQVREIPTKILVVGTIAGYKAAVRHTYMDSGQFALNWQVLWGVRPKFTPPVWYQKQAGYPEKGSKLTIKGDTEKIFAMVMKRENLPLSAYASIQHSELFKKMAKTRTIKSSITNPFWDEQYGEYPSRAADRPGFKVDSEIRKAVTRAVYRALKSAEKG